MLDTRYWQKTNVNLKVGPIKAAPIESNSTLKILSDPLLGNCSACILHIQHHWLNPDNRPGIHPVATLPHIPFGGAGWIVTTGCCLGSVRSVGRAGMTMAFAWWLGRVSQKARNRGLGWINGFEAAGLLRLRVIDNPCAVEENLHLK